MDFGPYIAVGIVVWIILGLVAAILGFKRDVFKGSTNGTPLGIFVLGGLVSLIVVLVLGRSERSDESESLKDPPSQHPVI